MNETPQLPQGLTLTAKQIKSRKARNMAIGLAIGCLVLLFYVVTIVKLGPDILRQGN